MSAEPALLCALTSEAESVAQVVVHRAECTEWDLKALPAGEWVMGQARERIEPLCLTAYCLG